MIWRITLNLSTQADEIIGEDVVTRQGWGADPDGDPAGNGPIEGSPGIAIHHGLDLARSHPAPQL